MDLDNKFKAFYDLAQSQGHPEDQHFDYHEILSHQEERYHGKELIATGGMKNIYKVFDHATQRFVAMATLNESCSKSFVDFFIREARLTSLLNHPNIIKVHDLALDQDDLPFFTMDLKSKESLEQLLKAQPLKEYDQNSLNSYLDIFTKVCDAISYAHSIGVLHLDLKPSNIQTGDFGEILVCDWGLGKLIHQDHPSPSIKHPIDTDLYNGMTLSGEVKGTPGFMSPEQIQSPENKGTSSDIYSLGAILYTILEGKPPISGEAKDQLQKTIHGQLEPCTQTQKISKSLAAILNKALALQPQDRYQSVIELSEDIKQFQTGYSTSAEQSNFLNETKLLFSRNKVLCTTILIACTVLITFYSIFLFELKKKNSEIQHSLTNTKRALDKADYETQLTSLIFNRNSNSMMNIIYQLTDLDIYDQPISALSRAETLLTRLIEEHPGYPEATMQLGYINFIRQDFNRAAHYFEQELGDCHDLLGLCKKFSNNHQNQSVFKVSEMKTILKMTAQYPWRRSTAYMMLLHDKSLRKNQIESVQLLEYFVKIINPEWNGHFEYHSLNRELKIYGDNIDKLAFQKEEFNLKGGHPQKPIGLLNLLDLNRLTFTDAPLTDLEKLGYLNLQSLEFPNGEPTDIYSIKYLPKLETLTLQDVSYQRDDLLLFIK